MLLFRCISVELDERNIIISDDLLSALNPALEGHLLHAWCPQGSCRFVFNDREYTLRGGDCMIIPRRGDMMRDIVPSGDFRVEIVYVSEAFIGVSTPQSNYGMRGGLALFNNPIMHLDEEQQRVCALNFDYIRQRLSVEKHHFHRDAMINAIQCMIIDFFDFHVENHGGTPWQSGDISAQQAQLMERLQEMLERGDCREHREVKYYADALCVTPKYLSEVCRLVSGYSASYWIARYTALDISRQLRDRTLSIEAVADLFHFSSLSHFSRYVQNNLGTTPSSFRE